jgi:pimeloyl-ACP methyl ester carboxylesterase
MASGRVFSIRIALPLLVLGVCLGGYDLDSVAAKSISKTSERPAVPTTSRVKDHFVTIDNLRVHYIESGTGHTVVLIHGNAGSVEDFEFGALDRLSSNYRVVAIDRPGHGSSDRPTQKTATVEFQAELLHHTLSTLGVVQPILVGHSWGAALALVYALKYPSEVSAMVLLAPAAYPDDGGNGLVRAVVRTPIISDLSLFLARKTVGHRMLRRTLALAFYPEPLSDRYINLVKSHWLDQKRLRSYIEDESTLNDSLKEMSKRYPEINIPVVIVTGDKDKIVSPSENAYALHSAIAQSRLIEIKDTGHELPLTHPEILDTALRVIANDSSLKSSTIIARL